MIELGKHKWSESAAPAANSAPNSGVDSLEFLLARQNDTSGLPPSLWHGWDGWFVMILGVLVPAALIAWIVAQTAIPTFGLVLRHPIETLFQYSAVLCIPIGNLLVWKNLRKQKVSHAAWTGVTNGMAVAATALIVAGAAAAVYLDYPCIDGDKGFNRNQDFAIVGLIACLAFLASLRLTVKLTKSWETRGARIRQLTYCLAGMLLTISGLALSEARPTMIRLAEHSAQNGTVEEKESSLDTLRALESEKDLRMDIADARTGGLSGLFMRDDQAARPELYFDVTGVPYRDNKGGVETVRNMPDAYLGTHVVGSAIDGLSLVRSEVSGTVNGDTLSSNIDWTFVFKNSTFNPQEARAQISLPPGAVVSGMTLWQEGEPKAAAIGATDQAAGAYKWVVVSHRDPALVTDLGHGRVLVQCYPVPAHKEMKLRVSMTSPLRLEHGKLATLRLPRLLSNNFTVRGHHTLRLSSPPGNELSFKVAQSHTIEKATGGQLLLSVLNDDEITKYSVAVKTTREFTFGAVATPDSAASQPDGTTPYVVESIKESKVNVPSHLIIVLDGSQSMKNHIGEIREALTKLPSHLLTSAVIANSENDLDLEPVPLKETLRRLSKASFSGGHNNLLALIKAADTAGETKDGAVLWIHGPQPTYNQEIYITSKFLNKPNFYEIAIDDSWTNVNDFLQNHKDIGPFAPIERNSSLTDDLGGFLAHWRPDATNYCVEFSRMGSKPTCKIVDGAAGADLRGLYAATLCHQLIEQKRPDLATRVAASHNLVTQLTAAVVLENSNDYAHAGLDEPGVSAEQRNAQLAYNMQWQSQRRFAGNRAAGHFSRFANPRPRQIASALPAGRNSFSAGNGYATKVSDARMLNAPAMQGATNGTIGPQVADATYVTGLNTAGTVRVSNVANLEATITIAANLFEIVGTLASIFLLISVKASSNAILLGMTKKNRVWLSLVLLTLALSAPGMINWFCASARDANLFN